MEVINKVYRINDYLVDGAIQEALDKFAEDGFSLVSAEMAPGKFGGVVMYLFFTKKVGKKNETECKLEWLQSEAEIKR